MNILVIETSTKRFSLAVASNQQICAANDVELVGVLSSSIIPEIQKILKQAKIKLSDIDGYAVGLGPGSFTSLRVGLSTMKGLAFAHPKPFVGISSLDILAMNAFESSQKHICTITDAKRNLLYTCLFVQKKGALKRKMKYSLMNPLEVVKIIPDDTVIVGDGIKFLTEEMKETLLKKRGSLKPVFLGEEFWFPSAQKLAILAYERFQMKKFDDINRLVPIYLYPKDCQVKK